MQYQVCVPTYKGARGYIIPILKQLESFPQFFPSRLINIDCFPDVSRNNSVIRTDEVYPELPELNGCLFFDDDMTPYLKQVLGLMNKFETNDYDVLCGLYKRNAPDSSYCCSIDGEHVVTERLRGIQRVSWAGFGCAFVSMRLLRTMGRPWFETEWRRYDKGRKVKFIHEDRLFCEKAANLGFAIMVDFDIEIEHNIEDRNKQIKENTL